MARMTWRLRLAFAGGALVVLAALAAGAWVVTDLRWRSVVLARKLTSQLNDVTWAELADILPLKAKFDLHRLAASGNPFAAVNDPRSGDDDVRRGKDLFALNCVKCHGDHASGGVGPRLVDRALKHGDSDWAMYRTITGGVPGTAMTGNFLPRADVWYIIAYLHDLTDTAKTAGHDDAASIVARLGPLEQTNGATMLRVGAAPGLLRSYAQPAANPEAELALQSSRRRGRTGRLETTTGARFSARSAMASRNQAMP